MNAVRISLTAEEQLDIIWFHIAWESSSFEVADRVVNRIRERFVLLGTHA